MYVKLVTIVCQNIPVNFLIPPFWFLLHPLIEVKTNWLSPLLFHFYHKSQSSILALHEPNFQLPRTSKNNIQHNKELEDIKEILEYFCN